MVKCLVTGGCGFLGHWVVKRLRERGHAVRVLDVRTRDEEYAKHEVQCGIEDHEMIDMLAPVEYECGSICDRAACERALEGIQSVVHCASFIDWRPGTEDKLQMVNVEGTRVLLEAAQEAGVQSFVYVSSIDVVFSGSAIHLGDEESTTYPNPAFDAYSRTKQEAEKMAISQNGKHGMQTVSMRPAGLFGPRDPYHVGQVVAAAKSGSLVARIGNPKHSVFQHVFVGNAAYAIVLAMEKLHDMEEGVAGECFFITDEDAMNFFDFMIPFVEGVGCRMPSLFIPFAVAYALALAMEFLCFLLRPLVLIQPTLTRHSVRIVSIPYSFSSRKARRVLAYEPIFSPEEARRITMAWYAAHDAL